MTGATVGTVGGGEGVLRVLAWPFHSHRRGNPYTFLLAESLARAGVQVGPFSPRRAIRQRADIIHVHWPEWVLDVVGRRQRARRIPAFLAALDLARRRGASVVWTVHNLGGHEGSSIGSDRREWRIFLSRLDGIISLSDPALVAARRAIPRLAELPASVIPHGHYRGEYPDRCSRAEAREQLGLPVDGRVVLAFGHIRPYKGTPELIRAFRAAEDPGSRLVVAGRPLDAAAEAAVVAAAADDPRVLLHLGFVDRADVSTYHRAADLVALPYLESLNSGAALLALSFDRPVLAPPEGSFGELRRVVGDRWVRMFEPPLSGPDLSAALVDPVADDERPDLSAFEWDAIGRATVDLYHRVREQR